MKNMEIALRKPSEMSSTGISVVREDLTKKGGDGSQVIDDDVRCTSIGWQAP
jgi:hypothetical protein